MDGVNKVKILIVNKFLYPNGGSETYIFEIGKKLQEMGHEVQFFGMEHERRCVGNRVESYTSNMDFHTGKLAKVMYPFKIIYSAEARGKIRKVLDDFSPDVVHLNNFNFQLTPSIIYEIRKFEKVCGHKINIVFTAHDYQLVCPNHLMMQPNKSLCSECLNGGYLSCVKNGCIHGSKVKSILGALEGWIYRTLHTYKEIDRVICPSRFIEEKLAHNPDLIGKTVVMHNFVDRWNQTIAEKQDYVLYFGRFCEEKGTATLLEVCRMLPEIPIVFAGGGPMAEEVSKLPNIENRGFLSGEELIRTISQARFSVFTSEWYENCPFTIMETQMYGTPVIASDLGGTPELLKDKVTGELFEGGNKEELAWKIQQLWNDRQLLDNYTNACQDVHFDSTEQYCEKLLNVYTGIL